MRTLRKVLKWIAVGFGLLVVILLVINAILVWRTGSRLREQIVAIRAAGDPVLLSDLAQPVVPPEENAATYLRRARNDLEAVQGELQEVLKSDAFADPRLGDLSEKQYHTIESSLAAYPNILPLLEKASRCPRYVPLVDYTLPSPKFLEQYTPQVSEIRGAMRLLNADGLWLLRKGQRNEALDRCLLMFRLCRRADRQPGLIGGLVALACHGYADALVERILQSGPLSKDERTSLEAELAAQGLFGACRWALKTERACGVSSFQSMPLRNNWIMRAYWNRHETVYLDAMQEFIKAVGQPWNSFQSACKKVETNSTRSVFAWLIVPAVKAAYRACPRTEASIRCLRVLNALQRCGEPASGPVPKLSDLGLPADATLDPYTGNPLIVRRLPDGWLVYSVGENLKDDGGKLSPTGFDDVGVGPRKKPEAKPATVK